jgi:hypothetical protein
LVWISCRVGYVLMPLGAFKQAILGASGVGDVVLLSSQTLSNAASVSFTSQFSSAYNEYIFGFYNVNSATDATTLGVNFSTDSGSNYNVAKTTTFYRAQHKTDGSDSDLGYQTGSDLAQGTGFQIISADLGSGADESTAGIFRLFNPADTTYVKNFYSRFNSYHASEYSNDMFAQGYGNTASAVNAVQFKMASGNFDGIVKLWGVK